MTGDHVRGLREEQMQMCSTFLEEYAKTKAVAEMKIREANNGDSLMTIAVAPHQVYGPYDSLFLPNFLANGEKLRIFGSGENCISVCYVDNYCHGLICAFRSMEKGAKCLGGYYVITDGGKVNLWQLLDSAITFHGMTSLFSKFKLPASLLYPIAHVGKFFGGRLTPYTVTMLTIDRWFDITNAETDLNYQPVVAHDMAWKSTLEWFKENQEWWKKAAERTIKK